MLSYLSEICQYAPQIKHEFRIRNAKKEVATVSQLVKNIFVFFNRIFDFFIFPLFFKSTDG